MYSLWPTFSCLHSKQSQHGCDHIVIVEILGLPLSFMYLRFITLKHKIPAPGKGVCYLCRVLNTLNLSDITSKFHMTTSFVHADLERTLHTHYVSMFKTFLHTTFHMFGSFLIANKLKAKKMFIPTTLPLYMLQKYNIINSVNSHPRPLTI